MTGIRERAELYAWLAAAFYLPEADLLATEFLESGIELFGALSPDERSPRLEGISRLRHIQFGRNRLLELRREYARLFLGPPQALVRPYESCYFGEPRLMTERTVAVGRFYEACGFTLDSSTLPEPPDHIAVELTFLSLLPELKPAVAEDDAERLRIERAFLDEHLARWADRFAECVRANTDDPFYATAAELLQCLVRQFYGTGAAG